MGKPDACEFGKDPEVVVHNVVGPHDDAAIYRCAKCGHGVTRPPIEDVGALYAGRDTQDYQQQDGAIASIIKRFVFGREARAILHDAQFTGGHVVDFACGSGILTNAIADAIPAGSSMSAFDFFDAPPRAMPKVEYRSFDSASEFAGSADLLTCFHALEHDDDAHGFLDRLIGLLKPGGVVVIEVPNVACSWGRLFGNSWDNWYLPFHRSHFSRMSLRATIEGHGLEVIRERDVHIPSFGRSAARAFAMTNSLPFLLGGAATFPLQWIGEKLSGEPSALRIVAKFRQIN
jgi:SAM-dependent methyltransferase